MLKFFTTNFSSILKTLFFVLLAGNIGFSQTPVRIDIDLTKGQKPVSPYIYGKNNALANDFGTAASPAELARVKDAGIRFIREGGGNNSTKYNWRLKLSSHPDWYNNVYAHDWNKSAKTMLDNLQGAQGMWTFQLLGKAAANTKNNFADYAYNKSQYWEGVNQNLAGGGQVNAANPKGKALVEGNPDLYLMDWSADSTVGILDKWFGEKGLGYDKNHIRYWNMDNEPEIWSGTHDDVMQKQCTAEEFMQLYFKVAKAARAKYPDIKLVGPVPANEWQWYNWSGGSKIGNKSYPWLEFFIKRVAEEEKASGIKLLDVLDIHFYPETTDPAQTVQLHRVFFDQTYIYPDANGVKNISGSWNNSMNKEYILKRCADWLTTYMGAGNGIGLAVTETDIKLKDPDVLAVWYASMMGEFMKQGVEIFTPWSWRVGMWETLHLFSRYNQENFVQAVSGDETLISAYPTVNQTADSMTVVLVNRSLTEKKLVNLNFTGYVVNPGKSPMYTLSKLGTTETFVSHAKNALIKSEVEVSLNQISVELAPMSVNTILLTDLQMAVKPDLKKNTFKASVYPNPANDQVKLDFSLPERSQVKIDIFSSNGQLVKTICNAVFEAGNQNTEINLISISEGIYLIKLTTTKETQTLKLIKK